MLARDESKPNYAYRQRQTGTKQTRLAVKKIGTQFFSPAYNDAIQRTVECGFCSYRDLRKDNRFGKKKP
jgi:hypothetical protein